MRKLKLLNNIKKTDLFKLDNILVLLIFFAFFFAYFILLLVKHNNFLTGYDLSVVNQATWEYSRFLKPLSSVHAYAFTPIYHDHLEFIYVFLSPFYWLYADSRILIFLQAFIFTISGIPVYLLAKKYKIYKYFIPVILFSYFAFYGVQNALWSDVHSLVYGTAFLSFFIYFLDLGKKRQTWLFLVLTIMCKEDMALLTFLISFVYFIKTRKTLPLYLMLASVFYILLIFFVYFPYFASGYRFANDDGLFSNINVFNFFNTREKIDVILYSIASFGFLPLLNPLALIPFLGDLGHYFILGNDTVTSAQSIFMHYRVTDSLLLVWPLILVIGKYKKLNNKYIALYLLFFSCLITYMLHAPLTYLSKKWFWTKPAGVESIKNAINYLPNDAYIATQVNISPHVSTRKNIVTLWGDKRVFAQNSPCGTTECAWFKWAGNPDYLLVDTSPEWDIRHLLANRPEFIEGLENLQTQKYIVPEKKFGTTTIYKILKQPSE